MTYNPHQTYFGICVMFKVVKLKTKIAWLFGSLSLETEITFLKGELWI
tara:strand:- start:2243 stop:2386 length:144 start_codon:yes stop_codon:yes gene_type:complete